MGCVAAFNRKTAISLKRRKIGPSLLLITNRKFHTRFPLVPKSMTLYDLERPLRTLFRNTCVFGAYQQNLNEDRLYYQRHRCTITISISRNIRFNRIFAELPWREAQTTGNYRAHIPIARCAIVSCLSACLFVCPSVTSRYCGHTG